MHSFSDIFAISAAAITALLSGLSEASSTATYVFKMTVDSQNTCGPDDYTRKSHVALPMNDCKELRDMHSDSGLTGTYTYTWDTPGNVPADTMIYGPWYGDCIITWFPSDYTETFTIGNQDIYDILGTAMDIGNGTSAAVGCKASGGDLIVNWEVSTRSHIFNPPGSGQFGNCG